MIFQGREYVPYIPFVQSIGLSTHPRQLVRRASRYQQEFCRDGDTWYVSKDYADRLTAYHGALNNILSLKRQLP